MEATLFPSWVRTIRCAYIGLPAPKETACSFPAPCALKMAACGALAARHAVAVIMRGLTNQKNMQKALSNQRLEAIGRRDRLPPLPSPI